MRPQLNPFQIYWSGLESPPLLAEGQDDWIVMVRVICFDKVWLCQKFESHVEFDIIVYIFKARTKPTKPTILL